MIAPAGKQITIVARDQQAVVVEVGGGLRSYSVGGRELLDEAFPELPLLWLDTEDSEGEVFWIAAADLG